MRIVLPLLVLTLSVSLPEADLALAGQWPWMEDSEEAETLAERIQPPEGFVRIPAATDTFKHWLRHLPVKPGVPPIHRYDGKPSRHNWHVAVLDIDCGNQDLQQCADSAMRLRAEYLFAADRGEDIAFNFTSGDAARWDDWSKGSRPRVTGNKVTWGHTAEPDSSYLSFRNYLKTVFTYAGTWSLSRELPMVSHTKDVQAGDLLLQGGFPGHAILLIDEAYNARTNKTVFLLAQGYNPAVETHVITNPTAADLTPWYEIHPGQSLVTPGWTFADARVYRWN